MSRFRSQLTFANIVSTLALLVALGGTSYAATQLTGNDIKNGSLTGKDLKDDSVTGKDVSKLTEDDFVGDLPAGPPGAPGADGSPDTPAQVLSKLLTVDGAGSGLDADTLAGLGPNDFQRRGTTTACSGNQKVTGIQADGDVDCEADAVGGSVATFTRQGGAPVNITAQFPTYTTVMTKDIEPGAYAVFARFQLYQTDANDAGSFDGSSAFCTLTASGADLDFVDQRPGTTAVTGAGQTYALGVASSITMMGISNSSSPRTIQLACTKSAVNADKAEVQVQRASIMTIGLLGASSN